MTTSCATPALVRQARQQGRRPALQLATLGLAGAGVLGAVALRGVGKPAYWPSLGLAVLALYGGGWVYGGWAGAAILCRQRPPWLTGAAVGVLTLGTAVVVGCSWNFAQEAIRYAPFPGTTGADMQQHVRYSFEDYVLKPLAWVMPLGSVLAALLGGWAGRRVRRQGLPPGKGSRLSISK